MPAQSSPFSPSLGPPLLGPIKSVTLTLVPRDLALLFAPRPPLFSPWCAVTHGQDERMGMPGSSPHGPGPGPGGPPPHAAPGGPPGRRRSESRDRDRPRFPPGAGGGGGPPYDGGGRGPPGYEGNPGQRPYPAGPGPAPGPGGGGGGQFYSNSNSSGPPPAGARAYPNQPPSGYPSQGGARGGYPPTHSNGGSGSGGGGYAQAPAPTLGGISEDEARRKDLRYLTVTRCSGEVRNVRRVDCALRGVAPPPPCQSAFLPSHNPPLCPLCLSFCVCGDRRTWHS